MEGSMSQQEKLNKGGKEDRLGLKEWLGHREIRDQLPPVLRKEVNEKRSKQHQG